MTAHRKLRVIACPSLRPELEALGAASRCELSFHYLAMALHNVSGGALRKSLQQAIDATTGCDAIAIGYGLCNRGVVGVMARNIPLVLPRAHDCIGMLLGSNKRYRDALDDEPGTYFHSAGWIRTAREVGHEDFTFGPNSNVGFEQLAVRYGEDAATYLMGALADFTKHYKRLAYVATDIPASVQAETEARAIAEKSGWQYHRLEGDMGWLRHLLDGEWSEAEFLVVRPGYGVGLASGDRLIEEA